MAKGYNQKYEGNRFEKEFCEILSDNGFWVCRLTQNHSGQPADVIAVRYGMAYLIDCKVCRDGKFKLSRIEDNQEYSMSLWRECGNTEPYFAMEVDKHIYMIPKHILDWEIDHCYMTEEEMMKYGLTVKEWIEQC